MSQLQTISTARTYRGGTVKVKNIDKHAQSTCKCGSWLKHWEKSSGHRITYCPVDGCLNKDLVGTLFQKVEDNDQSWFVGPLCQFHSRATGELIVAEAYTLVPADTSLTCAQ